MPDTPISGLTAHAAEPAPTDLIEIVDVSDTSMAASGTNKKVEVQYLRLNKNVANGTLALAATPDFNGQWITTADGFVRLGHAGAYLAFLNNVVYTREINTRLTASAGELTCGELVVDVAPSGTPNRTGTSGYVDNAITVYNNSGGFSAIALRKDGNPLGLDGEIAVGMGQVSDSTSDYRGCYMAVVNRVSVNNDPPDWTFTMHKGPAANQHRRIWMDGTAHTITAYGWTEAVSGGDDVRIGPIGWHIAADGRLGVGTTTLVASRQLTVAGAVSASGTTKEHQFILTAADGTTDGANVVLIRNNSASLFSAIRFQNHLSKERGAIGYGNTSGAISTFNGYFYTEASDAEVGGSGPGMVFVQSTTYAGASTYGINPRFGLLETGEFVIAPRTGNNGQPLYSLPTGPLLQLDHSTPVLTIGGLDSSSIGYGELRGCDQHHAIVLREAQSNKTAFYEYGGTLASGSGFRFYTGGLKGAQTLKMQIADDGVAISIPTTISSTLAVTGTTLMNGTLTVNVTGTRPIQSQAPSAGSFAEWALMAENGSLAGFYKNGSTRSADGGGYAFNMYTDSGVFNLRAGSGHYFLVGAYPGTEVARFLSTGVTLSVPFNPQILAKSTTYTAVAGDHVMASTLAGAWTLTLPASPTAGMVVKIQDPDYSWGTNTLTIAGNGAKINGTTFNFLANHPGVTLTATYKDATSGWSITA